jgi:hypothetical protein
LKQYRQEYREDKGETELLIYFDNVFTICGRPEKWVYYPLYCTVNANTVLHAHISRKDVSTVKEWIIVNADYF